MDFRIFWPDFGIFIAFLLLPALFLGGFGKFQKLLLINLISLLIHQFEEYRFPGYFPGMLNVVMFKSETPDRYPLNTNTAMLINVFIGWLSYGIAFLFHENALFLAIATTMVSFGNFVAHTLLFNIKGKLCYNPGMLSSIILFLPLSIAITISIIKIKPPLLSYASGIALGIILNYIGILKMIDWLKDPNTKYIFPPRFLIQPNTTTND